MSQETLSGGRPSLQALEEIKCCKCHQLVEPCLITVSGRGGGIGQDWSEHKKRHSPTQAGCPGHRKGVLAMGVCSWSDIGKKRANVGHSPMEDTSGDVALGGVAMMLVICTVRERGERT